MRRLVCVPVLALLLAGCTKDHQTASRPPVSEVTTGSATAPSQSPSTSAGTPSVQPTSPAPLSSSAQPTSSAPPTPSAPLKQGKPRLEPVGDFQSPIYLTAPHGDHRLYVVEQAGVVRIVDGGQVRNQPFLDISADVKAGGEQGLLSIAFSPAYADDGHVYVDYTDTNGDTRVVEFTKGAGDAVDPKSRRELLKVDQPYPNHNGGLLLFDPSGMLIIGLGDGGSGGDPENRGQNLHELLGKLLRIDPHPAGGKPYGIPKDNHFASGAAARPEIWAYGMRNPWRFSFGPDGTLYVADVGQSNVEEVDAVRPDQANGANYGWSVFEGNRQFKPTQPTGDGPLIKPSLTYLHDRGRCSITGGGVYAGSVAQLRGRYLYGDYCTGEVWAATIDGARLKDSQQVLTVPSLASFGVDDAGEMYAVSIAGTVSRITA